MTNATYDTSNIVWFFVFFFNPRTFLLAISRYYHVHPSQETGSL